MHEAVDTAKDADAVILIVGTNSDWETEGNDHLLHYLQIRTSGKRFVEQMIIL